MVAPDLAADHPVTMQLARRPGRKTYVVSFLRRSPLRGALRCIRVGGFEIKLKKHITFLSDHEKTNTITFCGAPLLSVYVSGLADGRGLLPQK